MEESRVPEGVPVHKGNMVLEPRQSSENFPQCSLTTKVFMGLGIYGAIPAFAEIKIGQLLAFPEQHAIWNYKRQKKRGAGDGQTPAHHVVGVGGESRTTSTTQPTLEAGTE